MGRSAKKRKEREQALEMRERTLRFWTVVVRKHLKATLETGETVVIRACDPQMTTLIVQEEATSKLKQLSLPQPYMEFEGLDSSELL